MTTPADPDNEEPTTTREPPDATGGLDPYPSNPGLTLRAGAPHTILASEALLVGIFARGSAMLLTLPVLLMVAAWAAWLLARLDARHRPIAIGFGAWAALALVGQALNMTVLAAPGPYVGWARVAFHAEQGTRLVTAALPAWMALATLDRFFRNDAAFRSVTWWLPWAAALVLLILGYPELRGDALRRVYLGAELAALIVAAGEIVTWARRRGWRSQIDAATERAIDACERAMGPRARIGFEGISIGAAPRWYTWAPIVWLVAGDILLLGVGAWRYGLFGAAYEVQQAGLLVVWGTVAAMQCAALVGARRRS